MNWLPTGTILGDLTLEETFVDFDGPRVFSCRSATDQLYIAGWAEARDADDLWLYLPLSSPRFHAVRSGGLALREVFERPEGLVYLVRLPRTDDGRDSAEPIAVSALHDEWLPERDFRLDLSHTSRRTYRGRLVSDDRISLDLVDLTEILMNQGAETTGGFLGGEFGYGAFFENDVFMMHPYCWCEQDGCLWCLGCECEYTNDWKTLVKQCRKCSGEIEPAPNFHHKASGTKVRWYKYIGRSMEVDLHGDWTTIFADCVKSVKDNS